MKNKAIYLILVTGLLLFSCASTGRNHLMDTGLINGEMWGRTKQEVLNGIKNSDGINFLTTSEYPFMIHYTVSHSEKEKLSGVNMIYGQEDFYYYFNEDDQLYKFSISFSNGIFSVSSGDKLGYSLRVFGRHNQLKNKYLELYGKPDSHNENSGDALFQYMSEAITWNNVPVGISSSLSDVEISLTGSVLNEDFPTMSFQQWEHYQNNNIIPSAGSLFEAVITENSADVSQFLAADPDLSERLFCTVAHDFGNSRYGKLYFDEGVSLLYFLVREKQISNRMNIIERIVSLGADVNEIILIRMANGTLVEDTPLALAVFQKNTELVQLLIDAGADPNLHSSNFNATPMKISELNGLDEIKAILEK